MTGPVPTTARWVERLLPYLGPDDFFVNLGASDGVSNDPIHPFLELFGWRGIQVEPVPHVFARLQQNMARFPGVICERAAVSAQPGRVLIHHLPEATEGADFWWQQVACLDAERLRWVIDQHRSMPDSVPEDLANRILQTEVECLTFQGLMERHAVERVDYLNIDCEGADFEILCSIDLERWTPKVICIESIVMPVSEQNELVRRLGARGYDYLLQPDWYSATFVRGVRTRPSAAPRRAPVPAGVATNQMLVDGRCVTAAEDDPLYRSLTANEAYHWGSTYMGVETLDALLPEAVRGVFNSGLTGHPRRTWFDDLLDRGPFRSVAFLGCTGGYREIPWLESSRDGTLDVVDLSPVLLEKTRERAGAERFGDRLRLHCLDLSLHELPASGYDLVLSMGCLGSLIDLDAGLRSVEEALAPGGALVVFEYTAEPRMQYSDNRLARMNAVLRGVPPEYFWSPATQITRPSPEELSALEACRSDEVVPRILERFELLHRASAGALLPALFHVDLKRFSTEDPDGCAEFLRRFAEAEDGPDAGCLSYVVVRKRA